MKRKNDIFTKQELFISHLLSERTVEAACGRVKQCRYHELALDEGTELSLRVSPLDVGS